MKKLKAPMPWVGSKRQLRDTIIPRIPEHHTYVEPFAGAAWVFLGKEPSPIEVLNDVDNNLITLYRVIRDHLAEFEEQLWYLFPSRHLYQISRSILESEQQILTDVERAVLFYYHIKNAFGGRYGAGFGFSKTRPPGELIRSELLVDLRNRLQHCFIDNLPFDRAIRNYDKDSTFFYCDPPYHVSDGANHYRHVFTPEDHKRLAAILRSSKGKWILSYDNCDFIRELYKGFSIDVTEPVAYTLNGARNLHKTELLISNF